MMYDVFRFHITDRGSIMLTQKIFPCHDHYVIQFIVINFVDTMIDNLIEIMYDLKWWKVTKVLFWSLFPKLLSNERNKYQTTFN